MLLIKMNLRNKEIKDIVISHNHVNIIFKHEKRLAPLHLQFKKKQIKRVYNKIKRIERKNK